MRKRTALEARLESDDEVRQNIGAALVCVFDAIKRHIKHDVRRSRTEAFLQWCEENPGEVIGYQQAHADRGVAADIDRYYDKPGREACARCPGRHETCVLPERADPLGPGPRLAIVGEGPGKHELSQLRPFVGASGRMLEGGLRTLGLTRSDVHWTNAVLCDVAPAHLKEARKCCAARLQRELAECGAPVIVPVGAHGLHSSLGPDAGRPRILEWRGSITRLPSGQLVAPTVHPAFVMRMQQWGPVLEADFARVGRLLEDPAGWRAPEDQPGRHIVIARHLRELERLLAQLDPEVAIDVETVGLGPTSTALVCLAISDQTLSVVVPWTQDLAGKASWWRRERKRAAAIITEALANRVAITHNGPAFDHIVLMRYGIKIAAWDDTLNLAHAAHSHLPKRLSFVVQRYCDVPPWKTFDHAADMAAMHVYNGRDSLYTAMVAPALRKAVAAAGQDNIYQIDKVTGELCRAMQVNGFKVDADRARVMADRLRQRELEIEQRCSDVLGHPINLLSPIQLRAAFFGRGGLGAHVCYTSEKTGQPSLGVDVMRAYTASPNERLAAFATDVLAYRRARKVRITNLVNPLAMLDDRSRIHPTWLNYGAVSGRFSSQGPNLMNLPTTANDPTIVHGCGFERCKPGKCKCSCDRCAGVRSIYVAPKGWTLVAFDAKQLEMRIAAYASSDPKMIAACESTDLHSANASVIFGDAFTNGDDAARFQFRQLAKSAGFAVCYMAEAPTVYERIIAMGVRITLRQVEAMLRKMRSGFRAYYDWQSARLEEIARTGYVYEPVTGRRRWLGREPSLTEAANFPIQGGAAGLMNLRLPEIVAAVRAARMPAKPIAQVHDSGTFQVRNEAIADFEGLAEKIFVAPVDLGGRACSFPIDWKKGERWA